MVNAATLTAGTIAQIVQQNKENKKKRDLEFDEDLEMREPAIPRISGHGVGHAMSVTLVCPLEGRTLTSDSDFW